LINNILIQEKAVIDSNDEKDKEQDDEEDDKMAKDMQILENETDRVDINKLLELVIIPNDSDPHDKQAPISKKRSSTTEQPNQGQKLWFGGSEQDRRKRRSNANMDAQVKLWLAEQGQAEQRQSTADDGSQSAPLQVQFQPAQTPSQQGPVQPQSVPSPQTDLQLASLQLDLPPRSDDDDDENDEKLQELLNWAERDDRD
jgi:hypothetical protein